MKNAKDSETKENKLNVTTVKKFFLPMFQHIHMNPPMQG